MYPHPIFLTCDGHLGISKTQRIQVLSLLLYVKGRQVRILDITTNREYFTWYLASCMKLNAIFSAPHLPCLGLLQVSLIHPELLLKPPSLNCPSAPGCPCNSAESAEICVDFSVTSKICYYFKSWGNITNTLCEEGNHQINYHFVL